MSEEDGGVVHFNLMFPMRAVKHFERWIGDGGLAEVGQLAEEAGFDGIAMSEHPMPDDKWLGAGGHHSFDPFVSLSFLAAATTRLRVITYVAVAGYRSPYLLAKAASSLDRLSGGRLTLGLAAGYLRTEFEALGADFAQRGKLLDAAIPAMRAAWTGQSVDRDDPYFPLHGHTALPGPVQPGGPPIWIGGNSGAAKRRAVTAAEGWMPIAQSAEMAKITKTPPLDDVQMLAAAVAEMQGRRSEAGAAPLDVSFVPFESERLPDMDAFLRELTTNYKEYEDAGVTWMTIEPTSRTLAAFREDVQRIGDSLIAKVRP